jgi:ElaB/YqjD/DUF883 family membrane-anchored ribosome-binding protein
MSTRETDSRSETDRSFEEVARHSSEMRETRDLEEREPQVIEREIDATRADMRATLEALERRFSFDRLVDMTVGRIRARGGEFAGNLTDAATQNPMPLLLTSIGLGWMMLTSRRGSRGGNETSYGSEWKDRSSADQWKGQWADERGGAIREGIENVRERAGRAVDQVHGVVDSTRDTLKQAADSTRETWRQAADSSRETFEQTTESLRSGAESLRSGATRAFEVTREQAGMARDRVDRLVHEQPLMLGALGLAAGAIIGALLPTSEHEDRYLGEMRNKAVKDVARKSRARFESALDAVTSSESDRASGDEGSEGRPSRPH